ncbi:MAG TPA: CsiV family protein [Steroidobacteraceae bacterium]|nr:CsiV family protein [Steroidobacteraceae bacterium]
MKSTSGILRRLVLATVLLGLALPALPQAAGYTVEIIVFRNGTDEGALADSSARPGFTGADVVATTVASRKLGGSVTRLNNGGLRVLGHAAWRQAPTPFPQTTAALRLRRGVSATQLGVPGITGKVIFERGTYLHLGVDLLVEDRGKRYRITEVRQVKADEIHYFDHPAIGVLAIVSGD